MRAVRASSLHEYARWYLEREASKAGGAFVPADPDALVATMREHHAGKMRPWFFEAETRWSIVELEDEDLGDLVFLEAPWTTSEGLVIADGLNYRILRRVAANAAAIGYLGRSTAQKHRAYYDQLAAGSLQLAGANRIAICSAEPAEAEVNPAARYYLLDGVGRCLPYMILSVEGQRAPRSTEAFLAARGGLTGGAVRRRDSMDPVPADLARVQMAVDKGRTGDCPADGLNRLQEAGFLRVGCWMLASGGPTFTLDAADAGVRHGTLYAFVSGREVLYLGKTTQPLRKRLYGYQRPGPSQRTNISGRARMVELLGSHRPLEIYALFDNGRSRHGAFEVNVAAGLEDALIREFQPTWNKVGR